MIFLSPLTKRLSQKMVVPGSKSVTNRALLMSAFADGESVISGILESDDCDACLDVISRLGAGVRQDGDVVSITGFGGCFPERKSSLFLRSSGTLARFLPGMLAACPDREFYLDATEQLKKRPLRPLLDALRNHGADITGDGLPLTIKGKSLPGGRINISAAETSQYVSGLMMAAPLMSGGVEIVIADARPDDENYIMMTYLMMRDFGIPIQKTSNGFKTEVASYRAKNYVIEADFNTALYFLALAALTGSDITVTNLRADTVQPGLDFLKVLKKIGAEVYTADNGIRVSGTGALKGGFTIDMRKMAESALTLAAMSPFLDAPVTMTNLAHIRGHECDRLRAVVGNMERLGVKCDEFPDGVTVYPGKVKDNVILETFNDHRVAMSFSLTLLKGGGGGFADPGCVKKTCPGYFSMLRALGCDVRDSA